MPNPRTSLPPRSCAAMCGWGRTAASCSGPVLTAESGCVEVGERCIVMETPCCETGIHTPSCSGITCSWAPRAGARSPNRERGLPGHGRIRLSGCAGGPRQRGTHQRRGPREQPARTEHDRADRMGGCGRSRRPVPAGSPRAAVGNPRADGFPRTVFGLAREEATMDRVCARYAERFGRHREDRVLE